MKIGIIVHSNTGNTFAVAGEIQTRLQQAGHSVDIERIRISGGEQPNDLHFTLENPPDASPYDGLIFGAPVRGFSISPVIASYLGQTCSLQGKKVACFVTKQLSSNWTGGNRAIRTMKSLVKAKSGTVIGTGIVFWKSNDRTSRIDSLSDEFRSIFA